ncbi:hypothetical protein A0H81_14498 [Grifola frondosa]|uniref:Uncharacterized protein n=1 Tax=Grifola frondosa TaxID=5627 RepID=A0A1C7LLG7_GRIFR|nr:hypothetical protein A0H81_14498 [Grifola frondosa]
MLKAKRRNGARCRHYPFREPHGRRDFADKNAPSFAIQPAEPGANVPADEAIFDFGTMSVAEILGIAPHGGNAVDAAVSTVNPLDAAVRPSNPLDAAVGVPNPLDAAVGITTRQMLQSFLPAGILRSVLSTR